jgi:glycosyltransferase involved in cell wall biosynthesis
MRFLFLSHYFPPEVNAPASRTYEHTREWVKAGHEVTVVTCVPNHPAGKPYPGYRNRLWQWEEKDGIHILRVWTLMAANRGFLLRTTNYVSFMIAAILAAPFLAGADVVISTSPQFFNGLAGYFVARIKRAPWILEIRDLWPDSILVVGAIRNRLVIRLLEGLERWAYRMADRIVSITDSFCGHFERCGTDPAKIRVIKNGVNLGLFCDPQKDAGLSREIGAAGKFVAAYFGTHGMAHHLETVFEAARITADRDDVRYLLVGDGAERARLLDMRDKLGLDNVVMLGQQPRDRMPALWGVCDASLVLLKKDELFKLVIPSKIFEAMAMERPIVLGVEGESRDIVEAGKCGIPVEPENAEELAAAVLRLADDRGLLREMGANGRRHVTESFDRVELAKRYLEVIEELVGSRPGATRAH